MNEPHPLFPCDEDDEPPEVAWIQVRRLENGQFVFAPTMHPATDLDSIERLAELYGGGQYELWARDARRRGITARAGYVVAGPPRALAKAEAGSVGGAAQVQTAPVAPALDAQVLGVLVGLMQTSMQQSTQLMMAVLQRGDQASKEHIQSMTALNDRFTQAQAEMMRTVIEVRGGGQGSGGGEESFMRGIEFVTNWVQGQAEARAAESGGDDGLLETVKELMAGAQLFAKGQNASAQGGPAQQQPQNGAQ